jgi:hypothetical protein
MEGLIARLLQKSLNANLEKGMQNWLALLKQECERQHGKPVYAEATKEEIVSHLIKA